MVRLNAQPADERALQVIGVEPIRLRPSMLARDGDARGMDDIGLDAVRLQPACQPKTVTASFICNGDAIDVPPDLRCFIPPAVQQPQQRLLVRPEFLQRVALDPRNEPGNEPTRETQFNH